MSCTRLPQTSCIYQAHSDVGDAWCNATQGKAKAAAAAEEPEDAAENIATPEEKAAKPEEPTDMELDKPAEEAKATKAAEKVCGNITARPVWVSSNSL